uniref:Uncharacterized protein n=1 Tax=Tetradesmus obliquus TaxID=3088 RepID=A0A383WHE8_TETOB
MHVIFDDEQLPELQQASHTTASSFSASSMCSSSSNSMQQQQQQQQQQQPAACAAAAPAAAAPAACAKSLAGCEPQHKGCPTINSRTKRHKCFNVHHQIDNRSNISRAAISALRARDHCR